MNSYIAGFAKKTYDASLFGLIGYVSINLMDSSLKAIISPVNNSKFAWYTKLSLNQPAYIGAIKCGISCALFVLIDALVKKAFDSLGVNTNAHVRNISARYIISIALTALASTVLGLTKNPALAASILCTSMLLNTIMLSTFSACQKAWYS